MYQIPFTFPFMILHIVKNMHIICPSDFCRVTHCVRIQRIFNTIAVKFRYSKKATKF